MQASGPAQDGLNRAVWGDPRALNSYAAAEGFTDRGEQAIYEHLRARLSDAVILDLGVGGGRTVPLLTPLARRYVALDYTPHMVEACRRRFPEIDVSVGDARDLSRFPEATFDLVTFSFNGMDAVDHDGRDHVLHEVRRVLKPGGSFWFSTLNITGLGLRLRPWIPEWQLAGDGPLRFAYDNAHMLARIPGRLLNYARVRPLFRRGEGWSIDTLSAHDYNLLVHYTSLPRQRDELAEHGFAIELVLGSGQGQPLAADQDLRDVFWFQILSRRAP